MTTLFHITEESTWKAAQSEGLYRATSLENDGFIHLSAPEQLEWVASQFYLGCQGLVLLEIESERLNAELHFEDVPGHGIFPHLYGPLNLDAVVQVHAFDPAMDVPPQPKALH